MNEMQSLLYIFEFWQTEKIPYEGLLVSVKDEGLCTSFIDSIRQENAIDQAIFLSDLVKLRPECIGRLLELTLHEDESVQIWAYTGLLETKLSIVAKSYLILKCKDRLYDPHLEEGEWPLHFFLDYFKDIEPIRGLLLLAEHLNIEGSNAVTSLRRSLDNRIRLQSKLE